jgi:membrane-associated protease RseP (regulator of RpoE activity)
MFYAFVMKKYRIFQSPYLHIWLFFITLITTTVAGAEWIFGRSFFFHFPTMGWPEFKKGFAFSLPFLGFLTAHEFGHYCTARYKKIKVSLPLYIPAWFVIFTTIGTFGAFIKIKEAISSKKDYFDIGIAGPLAGFVVAFGVLIYGFSTLPPLSYIYQIHPEYQSLHGDYRQFLNTSVQSTEAVILGKSLLYNFLEATFANPALMPHPYELTHYPFIVAGFLGLLFTAINLIPIGQLDGGHILYALIGKKAFDVVSPIFLVILVGYSGLGIFKVADFQYNNDEVGMLLVHFFLFIYFNYLCFSRIFPNRVTNLIVALGVVLLQLVLSQYLASLSGYSGFLAFGFLIGRVLGVYHPATFDKKPLNSWRIALGWLSLIIFVLCFSPNPIQ